MLLGNGGGGTSLLRGLLNAHSKIDCLFEHKGWPHAGKAPLEITTWVDMSKEAESKGFIWGNKVPIEQFISRQWNDDNIVALSDHFKIIWLIRRFSKYWKNGAHNKDIYIKNWDWARSLYWQIREKHPKRIIRVSFEDLLLMPVVELKRICAFLGVKYQPGMLAGTIDTGTGSYNQIGINVEKV